MAGVEGVEPSHTAPEAAVLPLDDTPVKRHSVCALYWAQDDILEMLAEVVNPERVIFGRRVDLLRRVRRERFALDRAGCDG